MNDFLNPLVGPPPLNTERQWRRYRVETARSGICIFHFSCELSDNLEDSGPPCGESGPSPTSSARRQPGISIFCSAKDRLQRGSCCGSERLYILSAGQEGTLPSARSAPLLDLRFPTELLRVEPCQVRGVALSRPFFFEENRPLINFVVPPGLRHVATIRDS